VCLRLAGTHGTVVKEKIVLNSEKNMNESHVNDRTFGLADSQLI
jgi:hypothetical protein